MKSRVSPGFTIIEVVLFLSISGLMAIGLLVGTGIAIQGQQYRDAVQSYADFLRGQYGQVINVQNSRQGSDRCPLMTEVVSPRGQSDCMIVGRLLLVDTIPAIGDNYGQNYIAYPLYALQEGLGWHYALGDQDTTYGTQWQARTKLSGSNNNDVALAMLRDPETGRLVVRPVDGRDLSELDNLVSRVLSSDGAESAELCIYEDGWLKAQRQSIFIPPNAGSSDAIAINNASEGCQ